MREPNAPVLSDAGTPDECACFFTEPPRQVPMGNPPAAGALYHERHRCEAVCRVMELRRASDLSKLHWHDNIEIAIVLNHNSRFLVDGVSYEASPGDMIVTGPRMIHQFQPLCDNTRYLICQLSPKSIRSTGLSVPEIRPFISRGELAAAAGLAERADMLLRWMETERESTEDRPNPVLESLAAALCFLLMRFFSQEGNRRADEAELQEFHMIFRYISEHYLEDITVTSIARKLYLTRAKVSALFSKYAGVSPTVYIRELRIDTAKRSLARGSSITEAALSSGFQNIRTFNNTFRRVMGITPSEYLRQQNR